MPKFSDLVVAVATAGADTICINQAAVSKEAPLSLLPISAATQTALDLKADLNTPVTIVGDTTINRATHGNRLIIVNSAAAVVITLSTDAAGAWDVGDGFDVYQAGAGAVSVVAGAATLRAPAGTIFATTAQYRTLSFDRTGVAANEWAPRDVLSATHKTYMLRGDVASGGTVEVVAASMTLPGGTLKAFGMIRFTMVLVSKTGTTGDATYRINFGGNAIVAQTATALVGGGATTRSFKYIRELFAGTTTNSQFSSAAALSTGTWSSTSPTVAYAVDTTVDQTISVSVTPVASGDSFTMQMLVEVYNLQ